MFIHFVAIKNAKEDQVKLSRSPTIQKISGEFIVLGKISGLFTISHR